MHIHCEIIETKDENENIIKTNKYRPYTMCFFMFNIQ